MKICMRCVMPETAESLAFDESGTCSVCRQIEYKQTQIDWPAREREFDALIEPLRGRHDYDCIVPFSGGKDSTFTLWYLVTQKRLKPLVVRFDHGFMRPNLNQNNLRTLRTLGADCVTFTPNWKVVRKLMFESLKRRGDFCWHCHTGIFSYPMWEALRWQVPLVIWGEPTGEYASFYSYDEVEEVDEERFNRFVNLGITAEDMLGMLDDTKSAYPVVARDLKPYTFPPLAELRKLGLRSVLLGGYIPWDVKRQVETIKRELGWQGDEVEGIPPEYDYEKIECFMQGIRDYLKYLKRGFGRTTHLTAIDIRNGRLERERAIELVERYDGRRPASLDLFLRYLDLSEAEFYDIVRQHTVAPHAFPDPAEIEAANWAPKDFAQWSRIVGERERDRGVE
ncbi:MAG: N-acetyl sugar amidotransferase [Alphaproteobacteria bacterium]|nr:N-acetyl sugar amidotransferase [Alphaproteobacteria bacterium]